MFVENNIENLQKQPIDGHPTGLIVSKNKKSNFKKIIKLFIFLLAILVVILAGFSFWLNDSLRPVDINDDTSIQIKINSGDTSQKIAELLEDSDVIKSSLAFRIYLRIYNQSGSLQAGNYKFKKTNSTPKIVEDLVKGNVSMVDITFYPGATLIDNSDKALDKKQDVTSVLLKAGYSLDEINQALKKEYSNQLFVDKPVSADLEGYIFGETYRFNEGVALDKVFEAVFNEYYKKIVSNNLIDGFNKQGLNLYQGITLASIIQKEANSPEDQRQVAQVFLTRLNMGMALGSDVTYQYIADKNGWNRDVNLDSPYNTRRYAGLTPGPISSPSLSALIAVANPAEGDYLYFLSDINGKLYFSHTLAEHEYNIIHYCKEACINP